MNDKQPKMPFVVIWDWTAESRCWHTRAGLVLDMIGSLSLFSDAPEAEDTAPEIAEAVMSAVGDHDGAFLAEWKRRFRADAVGATADWKREVEPELIAKWMSEPTEPVI